MYGDSSSGSTWLEAVKRDQITLEMWRGVIDELAAGTGPGQPQPLVSIMGGEPLMHPRIVELVRLAKEGLPEGWLDLDTNGTLLPRVADGLVDAGLNAAYVSLDGPTPEINNPIRGRNSYERAVAGLRALQRARRNGSPEIAINFVLTGMNYRSLPDMVRLAEELGVPQLTVGLASFFTKEEGTRARAAFEPVTGQPFMSWAGYCNEHQHADLDQAELQDILDEAQNASGAVEVLITPTRYNNAQKSRFFGDQWATMVRETTCTKLWAQTTVLPNGQVISCTTFADTVMGSLRESSLGEIWHGDTYSKMRSMIRKGLTPICYRCCELNMDIEVDPALYEEDPPRAEAAAAGDAVPENR
jgi:radical SAM protein with 4Fe4S-binding SPASM domain